MKAIGLLRACPKFRLSLYIILLPLRYNAYVVAVTTKYRLIFY
jgi:hypothetical protein